MDYITITNENQQFLQVLHRDLVSARLVFKLLKNVLKLKNEMPTEKLLEIFI